MTHPEDITQSDYDRLSGEQLREAQQLALVQFDDAVVRLAEIEMVMLERGIDL